ncbi:ABC transporter permease [Dongia sp.]|uniref:ABC transporter permease n=1 Tax=Dongia sp. TaxID=1977262 RepID=UPI0035B1005C
MSDVWVRRNQGMLIAFGTLVAAFLVLSLNLARGFGYYEVASTFASTTTLAIAAIGATIVVISRGLDLSVGTVISLSNCLIAVNVGDSAGSMVLWVVLAVLAGAAVGLFNAIFIVLFRLPSIIVTLAAMFIVEGLTLLVMEQPGGMVPPGFSAFFLSDAIAGLLPMPALLLFLVLGLWMLIKSSRFGTFIYAIGSDEEAARAKGVPVRRTRMTVYILAGALYGLAGVFLTAQTGSGDPTVGPPMLLPVFVAVVLGGTAFSGGRGGPLGTIFGAFTLMLIVNLLLVFNVPTFYSTVVEGGLLILAVLAASGGQLRRAGQSLKLAARRTFLRDSPFRPSNHQPLAEQRQDDTLPGTLWGNWLRRNRADILSALPAWAGLVAVLILTAVLFSGRLGLGSYVNSLLLLSCFLAVLALGQGAVVISGGLDLSVPAVITFSGVMMCEWASAGGGLWSVPAILVTCTAIGAASGFGVGAIGIHPLIMTLAVNGILEGMSQVITDGTPQGMPPHAISWLMTGKWLGVTPVIWCLAAFAVFAHLLLSRSTLGRRLYITGSSPTVAFFSGVPVVRVQVATYALSAFCAALVGILLAGFSGQAFLDMGRPYLLPSIAVVVIGGVAMTGGRGTYPGMLGAALLLTALSTVLQGMLMPLAIRNVIFGLVILVAVLGLREKYR